jgi:hypothetical protein
MNKIIFTIALSTLVLIASPVLAGGKKSGGHSSGSKDGHKGHAASCHGPGHHSKSDKGGKSRSGGKGKALAKGKAGAKSTGLVKGKHGAKSIGSAKAMASGKSRMNPKYAPGSKVAGAGKSLAASGTYGTPRTANLGVKFPGGTYYNKSNPPVWTRFLYSNKWNTLLYFAPAAGTWYYYHAPSAAYYPLSYANVATPTFVAMADAAQIDAAQIQQTEEAQTQQTEETEE